MKKQNKNKVIKASVAASCVFTMGAPLNTNAQTQAERDTTVSVDIYPKPQETKQLSAEGMKFEGTVDLVLHGDQSEATVNKVKEVLDEQKIAYKETNTVNDAHATILISTDKEHCEDCADVENGNQTALANEQGYILNASNDENTKGEVVITATDSSGAYYGVLSLEQMLKQETTDGRFAEVTISDYPSIKLRGFVEGFYGYPWSFEERLSLIEDSSEFKMNTYIYAPKDDPYHKDKWRELYPEQQAEQLRQLAETAKENNMSFCWNIHPGTGFNYSNDNDYNSLIAKFEQLYKLGVRQFGISYDDLGGYVNGKQQADLINRVHNEFVKVKGDVKPLIVVGTRYCNGWGPDMTSYFKPFFATLDESIEVMWTGANTMSAITKEAYEWPKQQTGVNRNLAAWWNYPVNDYCDGNLMMSPLENLNTDVDNLSGFFLNPMSQAEASKVAIYSGADYSWNVSGFEKTSSWKRAIAELVPEQNEAFERFADNVSYIKDGFEFDESRYLVGHINALNDALSSGIGIEAAVHALKEDFMTMQSDVAELRTMKNKSLLSEVEVHLNAYEELAKAGISGMDAFLAAQDGNVETCMKAIAGLKESLAKTETFTIKSLETNGEKVNVVKVGEKRIKPLLRDAIVQTQSLLMSNITPVSNGSIITDAAGVENKELTLSKGNYVVTDLDVTLKQNGYVGVKLPKAMKLSEISITATNLEAMKLQYSLNGITWKDASATVNDETMTTLETVSAAYVRLINTSSNDVIASIKEIAVKPVYSVGNVSATTDLGRYEGSMANTIDGNINTKFYSSAGATVGSFARVDFGKEIPLYDMAIYFAGNPKGIDHGIDGFAKTKLEISTDGVTWTQIGGEIGYLDYQPVENAKNVYAAAYNADGQMARYARFVATEASDNWVQIFEMPYNKTVNNLGDATISLVETTLPGGSIENLYDGDLTTAYEPDGVNADDTLSYALTTITSVKRLEIIQDAEAISNAAVSVKKLDGSWMEIGALNSEYNTFTLYEDITDVKLTFDGSVTPKLYEFITIEWEKADFSELNALIDQGEVLSDSDLSDVIPSAVDQFKTALQNALEVAGIKSATQEEVDSALSQLQSAIAGLDAKKGNKTELAALIARTEALDKDRYTPDTWTAMEAALVDAKRVYEDENAMQEDVDTAFVNLDDACNALKLVADNPVDEPKDDPKDQNTQHPDQSGSASNGAATGDRTNALGWLTALITGGAWAIVTRKKAQRDDV